MIVVSLLLILVAVTLLVLGLAGGSSTLLISSIVASLLAAVALVIGARQAAAARRAATAPAGDPARVPRRPGVGGEPLAEPEYAPRDAPLAGDEDDVSAYDRDGDDARAGTYDRDGDDVRVGAYDREGEYDLDGAGAHDGAGAEAGDDADRSAAYAAGRQDTEERLTGPDATQRVRPEADLYDDDAAAGRTSSGQAAGPAPTEAPDTAGDADYDQAATVIGGARATERDPWRDDADPLPAPEDVPAAARDEHARDAGAAEEFDEPDPDDPDDEPLPQAVRPADAVRVARLDAEVLVVDGRPRYHLADCPHLVGRLTEGLPVAEAVELGFSPCGLCRPVDRLVAAGVRR
ncbi:hypothetical protein GCM10020358_10130 [Amorphoplanes nipponensis]|uniref:Clumping factor A n=1 Tax=Actinoplanes nipponensis TaxID=135950 RepID=A0A919JB10_9ACTN|nr:hypothetical protein Ani05nite_00870 [Actinoplanes nipponensis]